MIITIWRKRTHNLICGPSSFLAATPPRREHLQLLLKTKNSAWADFLCNEMWEELKRSSRSIVKQWCSIVLPTWSQPGGKHKQYLLCFLLGHFGQGGRTGKGLKERKINKELRKWILDGYRSCMSELRRPEIWKHLRDCTFVSCSCWCWRRLISGGAGRRRKPAQREDNFPLSGLQVHLLLDDKARVQEIHQRRSLHRAHTDSSPTQLAFQISVCTFYREEEP